MIDTHTQLTILADALTNVIDLAGGDATAHIPTGELVERVADIAATALMAAATYGPLPPSNLVVHPAHEPAIA